MKWYVLCVMIFPILVLLLMSESVLWCVNIGSDTAPTRFVTQQNLNNGDRIAGFAALKAGFSLNGASVTGIFDSFFPVNGNVAFNDGTLVLWQDLVLRDIAWVGFMGNIVGNGHAFELAASVTCIPDITSSQCVKFTDVQLVLNSDVCLQNCCLIFSGNSSINGQGHILEIKPTCTISVDHSASLLVTNVEILGLNEYQLNGFDMNSTISFDNASILLESDYTFTQGRFDVIGDLSIVGSGYKFVYKSSAVSTVGENGTLLLDSGVTFSYDPPIASQRLLELTSDYSKIVLNGATFHATTTGMRITKGIFEVQSQSNLSAEGVTENTGIIFGDGTAGTSVNINIVPSAVLNAVGGCLQTETA